MTPPDWDDERLAAAFQARFDRPAPLGLERAVHGAIAREVPGHARRYGRLPLLATAAVLVAVVAGAAAFGLTLMKSSGVAPSAGPTATENIAKGPPPTMPAPDLPASVLDLEVITVSQAFRIRDAGVDDRELAVGGWFTPPPPVSCPDDAWIEPAGSPVQERCPPGGFVSLTEERESLYVYTSNSMSYRPATSPSLNPYLDHLDLSWAPHQPQIGADSASVQAHVVFLGHFDDRRSLRCPDAEQGACRDRFVVDQVAWVDGVPQLLSVVDLSDTQASSSVGEIEAIVAEEAPLSPILSMVVVDAPAGLLAIEPTLATGFDELMQEAVRWVVRVLESGRVSTYLVADGTDAIFEMTQDGHAIAVGGSLSPPVDPRPWPPVGAIVIELTSEVGAGQPPVEVAVVDQSGRLTGVAEKGDLNPDQMQLPGGEVAYPESGRPGRVHLFWAGSPCDRRITVTVGPVLRTINLDHGWPQEPCDAIGVPRQLVLDFSGSVDVSAIELSRSTTMIEWVVPQDSGAS